MGRMGKGVFKHFAEAECPRQIFLDVAQGDARWIAPLRDLREDEQRRVAGKSLADLGHDYEQRVYAQLRLNPRSRAATSSPTGPVVETVFDAAALAAFRKSLRGPATSTLMLLEHAWETPAAFVRYLFDVPAGAPLPVSDAPGRLRPDIIVLRRGDPSAAADEVLPDGSLRALPPAERAERTAITFVDIKHTREQAVGKSHLVELLYYGVAMSVTLREAGLADRFYVAAEGHGILPKRPEKELPALQSGGPEPLAVKLKWRDTVHLFHGTRRALIELHRASPTPIEQVPAHIQPACGRCPYVVDCVATLKCGSDDPAKWDVALLPFLRQGTAEQLRGLGLKTVGDVARRARELPRRGDALPLYAEVPALELKARALIAQKHLPAKPENTAGEQLLSLALPRYSDVELVFDFESDPTNDIVFAFGLLFTVIPSARSAYAAASDRWWSFWKSALAAGGKPDYAALDALLDATVRAAGATNAQGVEDTAARHALFAEFRRALETLREAPGAVFELGPKPPRESEEEAPAAPGPLRLNYRYTYVNAGPPKGGDFHEGELTLAERCVELLHAVFVVSLVYETFVAHPNHTTDAKGNPRVWFQRPSFAAYYWSREQLESVQDLLERHVGVLATGRLRPRFLALTAMLSPSGSGVTSALQHRKVFDLREFVETSVGHPEIINVTWHGVDLALRGDTEFRYARRYWAPNFNYMDFAVWHECLGARDANKQRELFDQLGVQVTRKLWALQRILRSTRSMVPEGISRTRQSPVSSLHLPAAAARPSEQTASDVHGLATNWLLYNQINGAMQELDAEYTRTTWPLQSIAKLAAAEVSDLAVRSDGKTIAFSVAGLSVNVKVAEGDQVLLLPASLRDGGDGAVEGCIIEVTRLEWNPATRRYDLEAGTTWKSLNHPVFSADLSAERWFLFPHANDPWQRPLATVLGRRGIATSWLGHRLAHLWGIGFDGKLPAPPTGSFNATEVYLFAPGQLPAGALPAGEALRTTAHHPPDASQAEAIRVALGSTVTCIQGPPGTGKSQTIVALIDEFLHRRKGRPARVLVTAFSYSALRVVLDKVRESRDVDKQPTLVARSTIVWNRSQGRDPIPHEDGKPDVVDLVITSPKSAEVNGVRFKRSGKQPRLDAVFGDRFVMFANAFSLVKMATESAAPKFQYELLPNGFAFDLIVIDEASQVPTSQLLASLALVRQSTFTLKRGPTPQACAAGDTKAVEAITLTSDDPADELTKVVIVGDDNQLPPVQAIEPPEKLRRALDSAFGYFVGDEAHAVGRRQLRTNYRSRQTIVDFTARLGIYRDGLEAFHAKHPYPALPKVSAKAPPWVRAVLDDAVDVSTVIHETRHETATSPLEALLAAELCLAFIDQMGVRDAEGERRFWAEDVGIVAPHNAQGRLVTRAIYDRLTAATARRTALADDELMKALRATIYSVEKFQGSDRTLIIGTVAISSRDQLAAEEAFIYDRNRFNVLTSRAKQKMVLICSRAFLDYVPGDREVFAHAARVRDFAYGFCDREEAMEVTGPDGKSHPVTWRSRR